MAMAQCLICFEDVMERFALSALNTGNSDTLRAADCQHPICKTCMAAYVASRVEDHRVGDVRCPAEGCKNRIFEQDVGRLAQGGALEQAVHDRFVELRARNFAERAGEFSRMMSQVLSSSEEHETLLRIWRSTKLCPRCSLLFEKASGCNSFYCICGHHFNFATAPRAVGDGARFFEAAVMRAQLVGISVEQALTLFRSVKDYHRAVSLGEHLGIGTVAAGELLRSARAGDEDAREQIRAIRRQTQNEAGTGKTEEEGAIDTSLLALVEAAELQSAESTAACDSSRHASTTDDCEESEETDAHSRQTAEAQELLTESDEKTGIVNVEEVIILAGDGEDLCMRQSGTHPHTDVVWSTAGA